MHMNSPANASLHAGSYIKFYAVNGATKVLMDKFNLWDYQGFNKATVKQVTKAKSRFFMAVARSNKHDGIKFYVYQSAHLAARAGHKCQCAKLTPSPPRSAASGSAGLATAVLLLAGALSA